MRIIWRTRSRNTCPIVALVRWRDRGGIWALLRLLRFVREVATKGILKLRPLVPMKNAKREPPGARLNSKRLEQFGKSLSRLEYLSPRTVLHAMELGQQLG